MALYSLSFSDKWWDDLRDALEETSNEWWNGMCADVFPEADPYLLEIEDVILKIEETNTCNGLDRPVEVWIDEDGDWTIDVN